MTISPRALIPPTANPSLEKALRDRLESQRPMAGSLGELEPLAVRLGLVQNRLRPHFDDARLVIFAADHGLAVDDIDAEGAPAATVATPSPDAARRHSTAMSVRDLLANRFPLTAFSRLAGLELTVVDAGVADALAPDASLLARKIAHGTRNARVGAAMSVDQAHAAMRAGMEIGDSMACSALACAGLGIGSHQSAALVLACMSGHQLRPFVVAEPSMAPERVEHLMRVLEAARQRHRELADPVEVLAAVGGFEIAMMTGLMLSAASRRRLIVTDGIAACAALAVAAAIAPSTPDYCVHARSTRHQGLDHALGLFAATALVELGLDTLDGTGAALTWSLVRHASALLADWPGAASAARVGAAPAGPQGIGEGDPARR